MTAAAQALDALGDPTRRRILELLAGTERTVGELVAGLQERGRISQPAVSQHLAALRDAGLVRVRPEGTRRFHAVDNGGVVAVRAWLDRLGDPFDQPLDALATEVARGRRARRGEVPADQPAARRAR
ncbi:metalloregulator ArsR/SmtB family transcription factor [Klenkia terrae]|uniref:Metalloregulator ArsR/SmtB family transcription factor n=1 Tax=Klenkia terrae TaxID=1052259 RepID=A0ABU8EBT0_9ACTN